MDDAAIEAVSRAARSPTSRRLKKCIRKGTIAMTFVPVICGSAFKNKGVQPLLDAVVDYLPAPIDIPAIKGVKFDNPTKSRSPSTRPTTNRSRASPSRS